MIRRLITLLLMAALAAPLAGCGKKDDPQPPPGKHSDFPRQYPR